MNNGGWGKLTKELWDEVHGELYKRMGMEYKPISVYGTYKVDDGFCLKIMTLDVDFLNVYVEYNGGDIVHVYKTTQEDKDFEKKYPYWVVKEGYPTNICGCMTESHFKELLPFMERVYGYTREDTINDPDDHEGMVQGYDGQWRWL